MSTLLRRLLPAILCFALGLGLCAWLVPLELAQMSWEVPGRPETYPIEQRMRPLLLALLCFIPFIGAVVYACMGTMSRYLSRCFINYFLLCTSILLLIYMLADFTDNMERFRDRFDDPLTQSLAFYGTQLPMFLYQILPYTLLLGTLWCLSRLSATSELTGMLQSGRSLLRLCLPIFFFAGLASLVYGICGFHWAPNGALYRQIMLKQDRREDGSPMPLIYRNDVTSRIWRIQHPAGMEAPGLPMRGLVIEQFTESEKGRPVYQLIAEQAQWNRHNSTWDFTKARKRTIHSGLGRPQDDEHFDKLTLDFSEKPYQIISPMKSHSNESMGSSALYEYIHSGAGSREDRWRKRTEWHVRIARVFSCMVLVLLAIPSAVTFQRRGAMKGIGLAILLAALMLFLYRVFPTLGESGLIQAWISAWIPNALYIAVAIWLFYRNLAHRSFSEWLTGAKKSRK